MHTPPPTRGSPTKRRSQRNEPVVFGTPSSMVDRHSHPRPDQQISNTSNQGGIQNFSPSKMSQPGTMQQQFNYLDHSSQPQLLEQQPNLLFSQPQLLNNTNNAHAWASHEDPFSATWSQQEGPYAAVSAHGRTASQKARPHALDTNGDAAYRDHQMRLRTSPEKEHVTTASVDPSLVYSSPSRPVTSDRVQVNPPPRPSSSVSARRIPYQHNLQDPRQELENARATRSKPLAPNFPSRQYAQPLARPELQRSNTVSAMRPYTGPVASEPTQQAMLSRSNSAVNLPRRSSPLKRERAGRGSLSSISETPRPAVRTSVVLTVDSNGRARTETRLVEHSPTKHTRETSVRESSMREKYPSLWDESDSETETLSSRSSVRSSAQWPSRNSSLTTPRGEERYSKVPKLDPPMEDFENLHLPRSNSSASLRTPSKASYSAAVQLRRQSSAKKRPVPSMHNRRNTLASLNSSFESLASIDMTTNDRPEQSDAGSALRQMMASRSSTSLDTQLQPDPLPTVAQRPQARAHSPRKLHQKSQSMAALPPNHTSGRAPVFPVDSAPMQPVMHSPEHTQFTNYMTPMFRCVCSLPLDDGRGMLQCGSCSMFLHAACLGVDPQRLPTSYICNFCTNSANMMAPTQSYADWGIAGI